LTANSVGSWHVVVNQVNMKDSLIKTVVPVPALCLAGEIAVSCNGYFREYLIPYDRYLGSHFITSGGLEGCEAQGYRSASSEENVMLKSEVMCFDPSIGVASAAPVADNGSENGGGGSGGIAGSDGAAGGDLTDDIDGGGTTADEQNFIQFGPPDGDDPGQYGSPFSDPFDGQ
ncbi:MAG: hypothetical protein AABZ32_05095, partial [Bacteroidota bacterium]